MIKDNFYFPEHPCKPAPQTEIEYVCALSSLPYLKIITTF